MSRGFICSYSCAQVADGPPLPYVDVTDNGTFLPLRNRLTAAEAQLTEKTSRPYSECARHTPESCVPLICVMVLGKGT